MRKINLGKEIEKRCKEDPEFRKLFDDNGNYYDLISELIELRSTNNITQNQLEKISGINRTTICKYERYDRIPSLLNFTKVLNVMGYELCIRKRKDK